MKYTFTLAKGEANLEGLASIQDNTPFEEVLERAVVTVQSNPLLEELRLTISFNYKNAISRQVLIVNAPAKSSLWFDGVQIFFDSACLPPLYQEIKYSQLLDIFNFCNHVDYQLTAGITYPDNIWAAREGKGTHYTFEERTYYVNALQWGFDRTKMGRCIIGTDLAFIDCGVRLDFLAGSPVTAFFPSQSEAKVFTDEAWNHIRPRLGVKLRQSWTVWQRIQHLSDSKKQPS